MTKENPEYESQILRALRHPLRCRMLRQMRDAESISPRKLSIEFAHPVSNLAYHMRVLAECDAVTLVGTRPSRGSVEHFYRISDLPAWAFKWIDGDPLIG